MDYSELLKADKQIADAITGELERQRTGLEMIPSENYCSLAVLEAMASILNSKYSEGYPGKRYYGGQEFADIVETLAIDRLKELFKADHANVQPYSGSPANMAVYYALLKPGDKLMGMTLSHGGHLTHGHDVNFSSKGYKVVQYGVDKRTNRIDYDEVRRIAKAEKPQLIVAGATAYPREYDFKAFGEIAEEVDAYFLADIAHIAGLIVAGVHQSPVPYADAVTSTTHKTLRGPRGGIILCKKEHADAIDRAVFPGLQGGPHVHVIAGKAVCFKEAQSREFKEYGRQIVKNCKVLADNLMGNGLKLSTDGTDNHLILADVTPKGLTGRLAEKVLDDVGITVNKNTIPFDTRKPFDPSGIRLGTPALTTRGMKEGEMEQIADFIVKALDNHDNALVKARLKGDVRELCAQFPIYPELGGRT
jgi:glycine hydroxymethyltransferase